MDKQYKSQIPTGESGLWKVEKFDISEEQASLHRIRCCMNGNNRSVEPGSYTKLTRDGQVIMSDTPAEIRDHLYFIHRAEGSILISGLGLGLVVEALLQKPEVTHITVVEKEQDVINLVWPYFKSKLGIILAEGTDKLTLIHADILEWKPPKSTVFDYIWHDIWDNICGDNWPEMKKLKRRFARHKRNFQSCWCEERVRRDAAEGRQQERERAYWSS